MFSFPLLPVYPISTALKYLHRYFPDRITLDTIKILSIKISQKIVEKFILLYFDSEMKRMLVTSRVIQRSRVRVDNTKEIPYLN